MVAVARYQPLLLHQATGAALEIPTDYLSLRYAKVVCGRGWFELLLPGAFVIGQERRYKDWRLVVWRSLGGGKEYIDFAGFVRDVERTYRGGEWRLRLSGPCYNDILHRRIIAYPAGSAQSRKAAAPADDQMKAFVRENLGALATDAARDISDYLQVQADLSAGTSLAKGAAWDPLADVLRALYESSQATPATAAFYGVVPLGDGYDMQFRTRIGQWGQDHRYPNGADGAVVFDVGRGNLDNVVDKYISSEEWSDVYGMGEGQLELRLQAHVYDTTRRSASVLNRREGAYENPGVAISASLTNEATKRLAEYQAAETFSATVQSITNCEYGVHWDLGDRVTVLWMDEQIDMHIAAVDVQVSEGGERTSARLAQWP